MGAVETDGFAAAPGEVEETELLPKEPKAEEVDEFTGGAAKLDPKADEVDWPKAFGVDPKAEGVDCGGAEPPNVPKEPKP